MTITAPLATRGSLLHRRGVGEAIVGRRDRRHRLRQRRALLQRGRGAGGRHGAGGRRGPPGVRRRPVAPSAPHGAGRVPAGDRRRLGEAGRGRGPDLAARIRRAPFHRQGVGPRCGQDLRLLRRAGRHVPLRGGSPAEHGRQVRADGARARRGGRGDHPVERPLEPHHLQDRPRPDRRMHGHPQGLARGPRRGLRHGGDRRGGRSPARRAQCGDGRSGGFRAAGARPAGGQDHLHRIDRRRASHRLVVRRAHRPLHPRARREVRGRHPRRHGPGRRGGLAGRRRVLPRRTGLLLADEDRRQSEPSRRAGRGAGRNLLPGAGGRPLRRADADGAPGRRTAARPRRGLHRQGSRRRAPRWPRAADARRISSEGGSSNPPSSAMSTTPRPSRRRRSSGRC